MQGVEPLERDEDHTVDCSAGRREHARDGEGRVVVEVEGDLAGAMCVDDHRTGGIAEPGRDLGADHGSIRPIAGEERARFQRERLSAGVSEMLEIRGFGADHRIAAVIVPHLDRHRPGDFGPVFQPLEAVPCHASAGAADAENGGHQDLNRIAARRHDQVDPRGGVGEAVARAVTEPLDTEDQRDAKADGEYRQTSDEATVPQAAQAETQHQAALRFRS